MLAEKKKQDELLDEIGALKQKVASANEGLAAANRLGEQLERKTQAISMLKHEVKLREDLLKKAQAELKEINSNNVVKVDRYLVKNLVVGYVNADASKKPEVLKVIATVLDFNQEERDKTGLDGLRQSGWLGSWFGGSSGGPGAATPSHLRNHRRTSSTEVQEATGLDLSLAQAFVAFLQNESVVKTPPKTLIDKSVTNSNTPTSNLGSDTPSSAGNASVNTSGRSTPTSAMPTLGLVNPNYGHPPGAERSASASPSILNMPPTGLTQGLPTFSVNRSSSSILKQVLYEEGNS